MRTYGRLLKNIAAIALLLALLSMLLPFCKFSAGGQEMTLSGLDVVKAGGRAGYTYLTEGRVADTFVLKAPITVGTVKSSLSYVQGVGQMRLLAVCAIAALLPVLLCFLSVGMLFLAEGKKTMLLPTLFTSLVLAELLIVLAVFPALYPFLLSGIYFFTLLHGVAWILILTGWITGGYRPPEKQGNEQIKRARTPLYIFSATFVKSMQTAPSFSSVASVTSRISSILCTIYSLKSITYISFYLLSTIIVAF